MKRVLGLAAERSLPRWHRDPWRDVELEADEAPQAVLFVDTFTRWFEPEVARSASRLLASGGWRATSARPAEGRPLCCGRTYLSAGMLDEARAEAARLVGALAPAAVEGAAIVGLEPSCLYTLRDEVPALLPSNEAAAVADRAVLLEEFLDSEWDAGRRPTFASSGAARVMLHGHCHQKALGSVDATARMLERVPGLRVEPIQAGCCGMAGAFGFHAEHYDTSMRMGELELLPAIRAAPADTRIVADGTSCRAQIVDGVGREAVHAAVVLATALAS
jgi:Fe-S oxidoreductase